MNKRELIDKIRGETELSEPAVRAVIDQLVNSVLEAVEDDQSVMISGFGRFELTILRGGRRGMFGGQAFEVPDRFALKFRPARSVRDRLKKLPLFVREEDQA